MTKAVSRTGAKSMAHPSRLHSKALLGDASVILAAGQPENPNMKDNVYKLIELTGTSTKSIEDAVSLAIGRAHKTIKNLSWFEVVEMRGSIDKGKVKHWQMTIKVGFTVEG